MPFIDIEFGEYLPDFGGDPTGDPYLVQAENVRPTTRGYRPTWGDGTPAYTLGATPLSAAAFGTSNQDIIAGTANELYQFKGSTWNDVSSATYTTATFWDFCNFDETVIACNGLSSGDVIQSKDIINSSTAAAFADLSNAPSASHCERIRDFLVVAVTNGSGDVIVQWPGIGDITAWHTAGTATALSTQAGAQTLDRFDGAVTDIIGGENEGIVIQQYAAWRMTYVGGDVVWQFDKIDGSQGSTFPNTGIRVNDRFYYLSNTGVWVTDGYRIENLAAGKFRDSVLLELDSQDGNFGVSSAGYAVVHDARDNSINWAVQIGSSQYLLKFFIESNQFTWMKPSTNIYENTLFRTIDEGASNDDRRGFPACFDTNGLWFEFDDTTQIAVEMQTGFVELSRAGREVQVTSVHPLGSNIPSTMTAAFKMARDLSGVTISQSGFKSLTASTRSLHLHPGATSRTGKYMALRLSGNFDADVKFRGVRVYFEEMGET